MSRVLAIDTDVLVHWAMAGAPHHQAVRRFLEREVEKQGRLGLTPQVLREFLHVVTDSRRFENPLPMEEALKLSMRLWNGQEIVQVLPSTTVHDRMCELLEELRLGRKRILDTALAATLEAAGITRLRRRRRRSSTSRDGRGRPRR